MTYNLDKSLIGDGIILYNTDSGCKYLAKISETSIGSGLWTLDFMKLSGEPSTSEVFKIMKTLTDACMEYVFEKNINNVAIFISGENEEIINQKTTIFQRWLKEDWDFEIVPNMEIKIQGKRNSKFNVPTNAIMMKRKQKSTQKQIVINGNINVKFCFNCGTKNDSFQFCPNCGTKF
jgi:hypothetical protein